MMRPTNGLMGVLGLLGGAATVAWAHVSMGGNLAMFFQSEALIVVFGGTAAALFVSYPASVIRGSMSALRDLARPETVPPEALVPTFIGFARKARRHGLASVEHEIAKTGDTFLARALSLSVSGLPIPVLRESLEIDARVLAERDEQRAQVLEAAAGYAPTLGIVGAVLGLMRVMQQFSSTTAVGSGIAAAFVATILGVGAANLVFLPLATRLRARARHDAVRRELVIDGVLALRDGASPGVLEERLAGYLNLSRPTAMADVA
jgi:chemotaxis protein MotA